MFYVCEARALFFDEGFLFLDRRDRLVAPALPEGHEQTLDLRSALDLDLFIIKPDDIRDVTPLSVYAAKNLQATGQRGFLRRVRRLERRQPINQTLLEDDTG